MLPKSLLYYGSRLPLPTPHGLAAGPLTMTYEDGGLRGIYLGQHQLVQRIYVAVRDRSWGTVPNSISAECIEADSTGFQITYHVDSRQDEIQFRWDALIIGSEDGTISFSFEGEAITDFLQSRIGFCILHPMHECMERACLVTRSDGAPQTGIFPRYIVASQPLEPFAEMTGMTYEPAPGIQVDLRFTGDLFEMEDQRNWTDASYKTFCTPLRLGYPHLITAGTRVAQKVTMRLGGDWRGRVAVSQHAAQGVTLSIDTGAAVPLPKIGLGAASHGGALTAREIQRLRVLNLSHLRLDLVPSGAGWEAQFERVSAEASALGVPLELALLLSENTEAELGQLSVQLGIIKPRICRWFVFQAAAPVPDGKTVKLAREALTLCSPNVPVGSGSNADFFDLNVVRPPANELDFVGYAINPQTHAFDNASLVETLPAQGITASTTRQFAGGKPIVVSPITLKMRYNPYETAPAAIRSDVLPLQVDPRQVSLFGAGWTLGSIKYLAECGEVSSLTYYETTGWRGVMETETGSPMPEQFPSLPGMVFPTYHVFAAIGEFADAEVLRTSSSMPAHADALALRKNGRVRILLANFTAGLQQVTLDPKFHPALARFLDETTAGQALADPDSFRAQSVDRISGPMICLRPFAVAILDGNIS